MTDDSSLDHSSQYLSVSAASSEVGSDSHLRMLEVCVDCVESASEASAGGADRLELCAALSEGGLTPSLGLLVAVKKIVQIPVFALIRSRRGDFVYGESDMDVMTTDVTVLKEHGADGFVFGCLDESATIEEEQCRRLLAAASPMPCTFHRAFDCVASPEAALGTVVQLGFQRVLTSGQAPTALQGAALIARLVSLSAGRLSVMPGGGVTSENVATLRQLTGVSEVHASARSPRRSALTALPAGVSMAAGGDDRQWPQCDPAKVKAIREAFLSAGGADPT